MGIFSWLRRRRSADQPERRLSLIRSRPEDPKFEEIEREAAADVAEVEKDAKYFGGDTPRQV